MTVIHLYDHPFESRAPTIFIVESVAEWLISHYGDTPDRSVRIFRGEPSEETEITADAPSIIASDADYYTVLETPGFGYELVIFAIAVVLAVAAVVLMPKPSMPVNVNRTQASPNNSLSDRSNKLRMLERVEDIYGHVRAIPSLMMPTYYKYQDNQQFEVGYYCISRGYVQATDIRDAETLLGDVEGASGSVYYPFTSPNSGDAPIIQIGPPIPDGIVQARRAEEIDGITLKAPNQVNIPPSRSYDLVPDGGGNRIGQHSLDPNFNAVVEPGDQISIATTPPTANISGSTSTTAPNTYNLTGIEGVAVVGWSVTVSGFANPANNGTRTVLSVGTGSITVVGGVNLVSEGPVTGNYTFTGPNYSGVYDVAAVGDGLIVTDQNNWTVPLMNQTASISVVGGSEWTNWVTLPDVGRNQVWSNIVASQGMYKDSGGGRSATTVYFEMQIERLDLALNPTGQVETIGGSLTGATTDEVADTIERVTAWVGPARVRMRRSSDYDYAFDGSIIDEIKWRDLYSVTPVDRLHFGNKTTIHTVTKATERATALRSRQLNCMAYRMLPTYNGVSYSGAFDANGRLVSGDIYPTSQIADIIAAVAVDPKIGQRDLSVEIDMPQIYSINQQVNAMHPEAGQFNYTFDSDSISFEETVVMIANAAFCIAYRQNGKIRLSFDRAQESSTALFTHRNKQPKSDTITRKFASDSEFDGVEFVYVDPVTENSETITLPLDGSYTKLKKFEIPGIRSFAQAWLRANREFYKIRGQRLTIESSLTGEARALLPNQRIDIVDNTRQDAMDGEVVGQNGMELTLSRRVTFQSSVPHSVVLVRRDGTTQSIRVTPGQDAWRVVMQSLPSEPIVTDYGQDGVRTIFSFAADSSRGAMAWMVQEIDQSDPQYAKIRAINYSPTYYQMDTQPIPPRDSIIN